jgi:phosphohistidine phosphatase SixA
MSGVRGIRMHGMDGPVMFRKARVTFMKEARCVANRYVLSSLLPLLAVVAAASAATPGPEQVLAGLRQGGYVILMRHASSPRTPPEATAANPDNVSHERQLDDQGRASARSMGDAFRRLRINIGQVLSSPTYRALETVRLGRFGTPRTDPELGDAGQSMQADTSGKRGAWIRAQVATAPAKGTNTLIVTHFPNIAEAFPADAKGLEDGEALIFRPDGRGGAMIVARVKIDEWSRWATASSQG